MKASHFACRKRYEFARCLEAACPNRHAWDIYPIWVKCASISLRQAVHKIQHGEISDAIEEDYMREIKQVDKPNRLAEGMGILTDALEERAYDFLGSVLGEWGVLSKWAGQFFTPEAVTQCMARMELSSAKPDPGRKMTLLEPACGGGAMAIAASEVLKEQGFYPFHYHWTCVDIDWRMFATCYVQLSLLGVPARVVHGNTLTLEQWDAADTIAAVLHPIRKKHVKEAPRLPDIEVPRATEQLSLF